MLPRTQTVSSIKDCKTKILQGKSNVKVHAFGAFQVQSVHKVTMRHTGVEDGSLTWSYESNNWSHFGKLLTKHLLQKQP